MNKPYWIVMTGCNSRHLNDGELFNKLKDARKLISALPNEIAYNLTRHQEPDNYTPAIVTTISQRVL